MRSPVFAVFLFVLFTTLAAGCAYWMAREVQGEKAGWWAAAATLVALVLLGTGVVVFVRGLG